MNGRDIYSSKSIKWDDIIEKDHFQNDYDVINTRNEKLGVDDNYHLKKESIVIKDVWEHQKVQYKNRLIDNPIYMGGGPGGEMPMDTNIVGGTGIFTGKSKEEKLRMCGVDNPASRWPVGNASAFESAGLLADISEISSRHIVHSYFKQHPKFNKYAAADFIAIMDEIKSKIPWFKLNICNTYRPGSNIRGHWSMHGLGLAVDINACKLDGGYANPWFAHKFSRSESEPAEGSSPPWGPNTSQGWTQPGGTYYRSCSTWHYGHPVVQIFESHGWGWGGAYGDVMHYSVTGG